MLFCYNKNTMNWNTVELKAYGCATIAHDGVKKKMGVHIKNMYPQLLSFSSFLFHVYSTERGRNKRLCLS